MTVAAVSFLSAVMPQAPEPAPAQASDTANGFAAMMAGVGQPPAQATTKGSAKADDAKDSRSARNSRDDKDDDRRSARDKDDATSTAALLGLPVQPPVTGDTPKDDGHDAEDAGQGAGQGSAAATVALTTGSPAPTKDLPGDAKLAVDLPAQPQPQPQPPVTPSDLTPVLTALADSMGLTAQAARPTDAKAAPVDAKGQPATTDAKGQALSAATPLLAGQKPDVQGQESAQATPPAPQQPAPTAPPPPATTAVLAARMGASRAAPAETPAPAPRKASHDSDEPSVDPDAGVPTDGAAVTPLAALHAPHEMAATGVAAPADMAGQQLAAGVADRQLDLAKQGAWLDSLSRDIASAAAPTGTVRFQVAPQNLAPVSVELRRGEDGSAVTLTTNDETTRSILSDARPQLIAEARAHGLTIADAQVDLGSSTSGSGGGTQPDSQARQDSRSAHQSQNSAFSAQTGAGGDSGRQAQTRSQPLPEYRANTTRADRAPTADAMASGVATSAPARRTDARYA